jgi:hypothetical protein
MRRFVTILCAVLMVFALLTQVWADREFYGNVEKLPAGGYIGEWVISGKAVQVAQDTDLDFDHGPAVVGSYVKVEGITFEGKFIAKEIETKRGR